VPVFLLSGDLDSPVAVGISRSHTRTRNTSMSEAPPLLADAMGKNVSTGDFIVFKKGNATLIGGISTASLDEVTCREFVPMSRDIMWRFCLQPSVQSLYPVSSQLTVSELVGTDTVHILNRDTILDIVFIVPIG
jgi:hypothetical protein